MILIKNGKVIENNQLIQKDILIENNLIKKIDNNINVDCETLDATGCLVMPGAVDVHVHNHVNVCVLHDCGRNRASVRVLRGCVNVRILRHVHEVRLRCCRNMQKTLLLLHLTKCVLFSYNSSFIYI